MMSHHSLTLAQTERLQMLAEEAAEVVQACTKILRHGYQSCHPDNPAESNEEALIRELEELATIAYIMGDLDDIRDGAITLDQVFEIWEWKKRYTHHQAEIER